MYVLSRFSCVRLFAIPWTVCSPSDFSVHGISRKEYWRGLPFPPPGYLPDPRVKTVSLASPALTGGFFALVTPGIGMNQALC